MKNKKLNLKLKNILNKENRTLEEAFQLYDKLETIKIEEIIGLWKGSSFPTGNILDGLLEKFNWFGKEFVDKDNVNPLVFLDNQRKRFNVDPSKIPIGFLNKVKRKEIKNTNLLKNIFLILKFKTNKSSARLSMIEYLGKISVAMIYDNLPIIDIFRKIDQNTLLGVMDMKSQKPFFFMLKREESTI